MAHAPGWIELYGRIEDGDDLPADLIELCKAGRTSGIGETMVHWYAIEGEPWVVQRLIDLGFDFQSPDTGGHRPIFSASILRRWDMVRTLRAAGADTRGVTSCGESYRALVTEAGDAVPEDLRGDAYQLDDLLLPGSPEDVDVGTLTITRSGLPASAPGHPITIETWREYLGQDAEFEALDEDRCASLTFRPDEPWAGTFLFNDDPKFDHTPHLSVFGPQPRTNRAVYRITQWFGARVLWDFLIPPEYSDS